MRIRQTKRFRRNSSKVFRRGKKEHDLIQIVKKIATKKLKKQNKDHALKGNWKGHRECHIESDWLLVYRFEEDILVLVDTGSHADIFGS